MGETSTITSKLDWALRASLFLLALSAPISIAATQTAWAFAILFWILRAFFVRPTLRKDGIDLAILAFIALTVVSSAFSYEPEVSLRKLVAVSLVTIVYLVSGYIRDVTTLRRIVVVLLIAGVVSVAYSLGMLAVGKNLKVVRLAADSPLAAAGVAENDTILTANGKSVNSPNELAAAIDSTEGGVAKLRIYRYEFLLDHSLSTATIPSTGDNAARFGIVEWSRGRDTRTSGFFGHYTTYAEALQLILSLAFGLMIIVPGRLFTRSRMVLGAAVAAFCVALFLTVTRASWAGFAVSAGLMVVIGTSRKTVLICLVCALPLALAGLLFLQQKRNVAFIDANDGSTSWRMTVWREGSNLLVSSPRHLAVGIGMDSIKTHYLEWGLFDNGKLPMGHMHSTPLQIALERGVPTLIAWIVWMFLYIQILWRGYRRKDLAWFERGVLLGSLGGTVGFVASGLVHYNWGDSEVVMIFYLLMGLSLAIFRFDSGSLDQAIDPSSDN
jgi:hypothetical protein